MESGPEHEEECSEEIQHHPGIRLEMDNRSTVKDRYERQRTPGDKRYQIREKAYLPEDPREAMERDHRPQDDRYQCKEVTHCFTSKALSAASQEKGGGCFRKSLSASGL